MKNRLFNQLNLYERNIYKYLKNNIYVLKEDNIFNEVCCFLYAKLNRIFLHKVFINYIEVPITTKCSLRCKECANLIQFYACGEFINWQDIVSDVNKISQISDGIGMVRILGGEPLLHPELDKIVIGLIKDKSIKSIQIVTNGTMTFKDNVVKVLKDPKVSVDISNYGNISRKYGELVKQLKKNHVKYFSHSEMVWKEQMCLKSNNLSPKQLEKALKDCKMDCINLLNGKLHLCPRSSHGNELGLFNSDKRDFADIRGYRSKKKMKNDIRMLLNTKSIIACSYCYVYKWNQLKDCKAGEQIGKDEALNMLSCVSGFKTI